MIVASGNNIYEENVLTQDFLIFHKINARFDNITFHSHDFYEIIFFLGGEVEYYIEARTYNLVYGDILIIPPGKMHRMVITKNKDFYDRIILWVSPQFVNAVFEKSSNLNLNNPVYSNLLTPDSKDIKKHKLFTDFLVNSNPTDLDYYKETRCYLTLLLISLNKNHIPSQTPIPIQTDSNFLIQQVIIYINDNIDQTLNLDLIAENFFISKFHLMRKFKEYTNCTIHSYILSKRIVKAKKMLKNGTSSKETAFACGFSTYANFYKAFLSKTGCKPSDFMNK